MAITLDIGGEGAHAAAYNVNRCRHKTLGPKRGTPIPRLLVARADALPVADRSIHRVVVERTPLTRAAAAEIARVIAPGGVVVLRHVPLPGGDRHALAVAACGGMVSRRRRRLRGQWVEETTIRLPPAATHG